MWKTKLRFKLLPSRSITLELSFVFQIVNFLKFNLNFKDFFFSLNHSEFNFIFFYLFNCLKASLFSLNHLEFNGSKGWWLILWTRGAVGRRQKEGKVSCGKYLAEKLEIFGRKMEIFGRKIENIWHKKWENLAEKMGNIWQKNGNLTAI